MVCVVVRSSYQITVIRNQQVVGSSPISSSSSSQAICRLRRAFSFHYKAHRALIEAAPRVQTELASLGFGLGPPLRGGFVFPWKISILTVPSKKEDMTFGHVFLFGFRRPEGGFTLRYWNARSRQSRPCAIPGHRPGIYGALAPPARRPVG